MKFNYCAPVKKFALAALALGVLGFSTTGCTPNSSGFSATNPDALAATTAGGSIPGVPVSPSTGNLGAGAGIGGGGSGAGGALSPADTSGLQNSLAASNAIAPQDPAAAALSAALLQQIQALMAQEQQGKDVAVQKLILVGKLLAQCATNVSRLRPYPGQQFQGHWTGAGSVADPSNGNKKAACNVAFDVTGPGALQTPTGPNYPVTGDTQGTLTAAANGDGTVQATPWAGYVTTLHGTLRNNSFMPSTGGKNSKALVCDANVNLVASQSPIPANYNEAMKELGRCMGQAATVTSGVMDALLTKVDPSVQALMLQQLGFSTGGSTTGN